MASLMLAQQLLRRQQGWRTNRVRFEPESPGFSLVELLIVAGLTALVLAGLGALTLVSDVQTSRRTNSVQEAQEQWGRAVAFMQTEVADAAFLSSGPPANYPCIGAIPDPVLVLTGPSNAWTIIYGIRPRATGEEGLYRGPNLLVRCGPQPLASPRNPPDPNTTATYGYLDETQANRVPQSQTVLLDRLPAVNPMQVVLLGDPAIGPVLDAQLTITMQAGIDSSSTFGGDQPFRVHVQRTP
jgi:type II secretory pathway pseudopilin PulG